MNKSAEQTFEDYKKLNPEFVKWLSENKQSTRYEAFIAAHHSRDGEVEHLKKIIEMHEEAAMDDTNILNSYKKEVKKLVEVLDELLKDRIWEPNWDKAKEAIKPYQK